MQEKPLNHMEYLKFIWKKYIILFRSGIAVLELELICSHLAEADCFLAVWIISPIKDGS